MVMPGHIKLSQGLKLLEGKESLVITALGTYLAGAQLLFRW